MTNVRECEDRTLERASVDCPRKWVSERSAFHLEVAELYDCVRKSVKMCGRVLALYGSRVRPSRSANIHGEGHDKCKSIVTSPVYLDPTKNQTKAFH